MQAIGFNKNWKYRRLGKAEEWKEISLPHDAMIGEARRADCRGGTDTGWFEGFDYEYAKTFFIPADYAEKEVTFEFEGVYRNAEVYINGKKAMYRPYGYTNFYVPANGFLKFGEDNEINVIARNADQPNSRWYSGAGMYRPVTMFVAEKKHILLNGIKIKTLQINPAVLEIRVKTNACGTVKTVISKDGKMIAERTGISEKEAVFTVEIPDAVLWCGETPTLYECKAEFEGDTAYTTFGIRTITCDSKNGFCINGKRVILRGACVHHDNGILGARCYEEAEERKVRILKENGYNAIRSAHNPCSKALLAACDKLGMAVVDEYADMWYIHKTMYDYADYIVDWYEKDIADMVDKDYNHPSVIMYSLGNEVAETAQKKGIDFFKKMRDVCKKYDADRPVTVGVNIFFNWLHSIGLGVYSDKKAKINPKKKTGSAFFNGMAGIFGASFMKKMATMPACDRKTRKCFAAMDVAGYNYGILRYKGDVKKYPQRVILGSETFCSDAYSFWEFAKKHNAIIGDFVWSGIDYLGETGVGAWEYRDYAPDFTHGAGWIASGCGRIDLIGNPLGEALYTKVAFEQENIPLIAVVPVNHTGERHSPSAWKFSNALPSWSWNGLNGKKAKVEVYSRAPMVELYINGKKVGRKSFGKNCRFVFKVKYYNGEITAVNLDNNGNEISRNSLITAGEETFLSVMPEKYNVKRGEVCFVRLRYTDKTGTVKPLEQGVFEISVRGGELLAVGNACPFNLLGYGGVKTETYYGEAMAVIKAGEERIYVEASDGKLRGRAAIIAK